ncbi:hypothetical protein T07_3822 [Trichinella nelsoni]|uniref:Retrotransposon gag domain-containing protein n=1 Tax=Trichinella nelsoni TaxID=6336 RepID=A0A0V0SMR2_9BILA|nr:hypothetical protein T07_3822 [Trichinella nelsoni]
MAMLNQIEAFQREKGASWELYVERLNFYFEANDITSAEKKRAILMCVKEHFNPAPSEIVFRLRFHKRSQRPNESITEYVAALMHLSENCNFGNTLDDMLRDRLVGGIRDEVIQRGLLAEPNLTFDLAQKIAIAAETAQRNTEEIRTSNNDPAFISTVEILSLKVVDPKSGDDTTSVVGAMKLASILRIFIDLPACEEFISYCARKKIRDKGLAECLTAVKNNLVNDVKILLCEEYSKTPDVATLIESINTIKNLVEFLNEKLEDHFNTTTVTINNAVLHCEQKVTALETTVLGQTKNITDFQQNLLACMDLTEYLLKSTLVQLFEELSSNSSLTRKLHHLRQRRRKPGEGIVCPHVANVLLLWPVKMILYSTLQDTIRTLKRLYLRRMKRKYMKF